MDLFKKASKQKLRFLSDRGAISTEDLWSLPLTSLDKIAIALDKEVTDSGTKSFISVKSDVNETATLKLEIVKVIINDKLEAKVAAEKRASNKANRDRIIELIAKKQDQELEGKSKEDLLKELDKYQDD